MSSESPKARDSRFYCFLSDYRARIFGSTRLGLVFSEDPVSGSDFTNRPKSRARILKHGSRRLGESRILPFYTRSVILDTRNFKRVNQHTGRPASCLKFEGFVWGYYELRI